METRLSLRFEENSGRVARVNSADKEILVSTTFDRDNPLIKSVWNIKH